MNRRADFRGYGDNGSLDIPPSNDHQYRRDVVERLQNDAAALRNRLEALASQLDQDGQSKVAVAIRKELYFVERTESSD